MANCIACYKPLNFLNTPIFNKGRTRELGIVCSSCYMSLATDAGHIFKNVGHYSNDEVCEAVKKGNAQKLQAKVDKKIAFEQKVEEYKSKLNSDAEKLQQIKNTISKLNPSVANKREVNELPSVLMDDEIIEKISAGFLDEGKGSTGHGLLIATNYRAIFIDKSLIGFGIKMEDFPYDKISSVSVETGFMKGVVKIICSGNTAKINLMVGAKEFSEFIRQKTISRPTIPNRSEPNVLEQIEKLADLKAKGILSEEEFLDKKAQLLSKL
ncbi:MULTISPECIES: PH domain-containing protein [unclassified Flavobacterium]|uniref:PH domain-containing protein n=1 Tax=unclassified Flavobacterium TaxID=196869 RepID=UPI001F12BCDA|nr:MULTISPECIES: PH domain-containing protein [unclassified Flavobacterium]UMY64923.1 PH domain-containing protein [Flavobacterium sp. HJ-32-4]